MIETLFIHITNLSLRFLYATITSFISVFSVAVPTAPSTS